MAKLLFISKDVGGTKMLVPIAKEAKVRGYKVRVVSEGMGSLLWHQAGIEPFFLDSSDSGVASFTPKAGILLNEIRPDVILTEVISTSPVIREVGFEANRRGIPVVMVEDYWAGRKRLLEVEPSLILTIDEYAKRIADEAVEFRIPVEVIGNHAVIDLKNYKPPEQAVDILREARKRFGELFAYVGGGTVEADLKILIPSLLSTPGNWGLVPRYHPKLRDLVTSQGKKFSEDWNELLKPIHDRVVYCDIGNSDDMVFLTDACFAYGGSSSISTAIAAGKPTIVIKTPELMTALLAAHVEEIPWVALGATPTIEQPQNLRPLLISPPDEARKKFLPLQPERAMEFIEKLLLNPKKVD